VLLHERAGDGELRSYQPADDDQTRRRSLPRSRPQVVLDRRPASKLSFFDRQGAQSSVGAPVNRWCGSSIQAVQVAGGMILMGAGDAFVAGGTESMSRVWMLGFNVMPPPSWSQQEVLDFIK
jgi:hypothetical protein